jgi:antirestriction protein ArdC
MTQGVLFDDGPCALDIVTNLIIEAIEQGGGAMPWHSAGAPLGLPLNPVTNVCYRDINILALWSAARLAGFRSCYWATFEQWKHLGARINKGQRASPVLVQAKECSGAGVREGDFPIKRLGNVFNYDQTYGWTPCADDERSLRESYGEAESIIVGSGALIRVGGDRAEYLAEEDVLVIPRKVRLSFNPLVDGSDEFYASVFRELVRRAIARRRLRGHPGSSVLIPADATEDLIADVGASFLCADIGVRYEGVTRKNDQLSEIDVFRLHAGAADELAKCATAALAWVLWQSAGSNQASP